MRRCEIVALRAEKLGWDELSAVLPATLEAIGLIHDEAGADGFVTVRDHGEAGRVVLVDNASLARRAALALSTRSSTSIQLFEVIGTSGSKRNRFRTTAFVATPAGELKPAEGQELDLEDAERTWGGGGLEDQSSRVLEEFALLSSGAARTLKLGYRKRPKGRPSSPRVAALLQSLQKATSHEAVPRPGGRVELRITLAAGGKQTSFCSAAELEELQRLLG